MSLLVMPTGADLRADPRLTQFWIDQGYGTGSPPPDPLDARIALAWAYIELMTCLDLDSLDASSPEAIIALDLVTLVTMQESVTDSSDFISSAADDLIQSFSVPGYSETRFDPLRSTGSSSTTKLTLNPLPSINNMLLAIMTDDCLDKWLFRFGGDPPPASAVVEMDWLAWTRFLGGESFPHG